MNRQHRLIRDDFLDGGMYQHEERDVFIFENTKKEKKKMGAKYKQKEVYFQVSAVWIS